MVLRWYYRLINRKISIIILGIFEGQNTSITDFKKLRFDFLVRHLKKPLDFLTDQELLGLAGVVSVFHRVEIQCVHSDNLTSLSLILLSLILQLFFRILRLGIVWGYSQYLGRVGA